MVRFSFLAAFCLTAGISCACADEASAPVTLANTGYLQQIVPVEKGVWLLVQPKFQVQPDGNVTVIEQKDGLVLVDAGGSKGSGTRVVEMVRSLSSKPVKAIVISQWHGDKPQGLSEILKAWPNARTISTAATQAHLRDPATMNTPASPDAAANDKFQKQVQAYEGFVQDQAVNSEAMRRHYEALLVDLRQWAQDMDGALTLTTRESFSDKLVIADPRAPAEVLFLGRANTDGDAVVWLPKQRVLVAGETVILPFPYGFGSYPADWIAVLDKIRSMPFRILLPGHGMPQRDRSQIDKITAALKNVRAQVAPLAAQGLTLEQVRAKVDLGADATAFVGDDPWLRKWFKSFWADSIVAGAYKEAKGEPIVQSVKG